VPTDDELDRLLRPSPASPFERLRPIVAALGARRLLAIGAVLALVALGVVWAVAGRGSTAELNLPRAQPVESAATVAPSTTSGSVVVHVAGAVLRPGLVQLPAGARVADALSAAGGARPDADLDRLNLAALCVDGARVYVPALGQPAVPPVDGATANGGAAASSPDAGPLDLNTATEAELDALPGIGPSTAAAIVAHRDAEGPYRSVDDLDEVRGIGPARLEQLRELVTVS